MKSFFLAVVLSGFLMNSTRASAEGLVIGNLMGQFGNQMFQIAATIALAKQNKADFYFPDLTEKDENNIFLNYQNIFYRIKNINPQYRPSYTYNQMGFCYIPISYNHPMNINGYFQSEKFFDGYQDEILPLFAPNESIVSYLNEHYSDIITHPNSVAIHVRTYHKEDPGLIYYVLNGRSYVEKAVQYFSEDCLFVVFSDDISWCKQHLQGIRPNMIFIEGEHYHHDFYLMSYCKNQIISNSSFSWWAAYLNSNPSKRVIAPLRWFNPNYITDTQDVLPPSWIAVDY